MRKAITAVTLSAVIVFSSSAATPLTVVAHAKSSKVYVAPYSGTKYHKTKKCRGLKNARKIDKISRSRAKKLGYKKCKLCKPK